MRPFPGPFVLMKISDYSVLNIGSRIVVEQGVRVNVIKMSICEVKPRKSLILSVFLNRNSFV